MGYSNFNKALKEVYRILKPGGKLYIKEIVSMKLDDKYSLTSLANLNHFRRSWMYNTITIDEIMEVNTFIVISPLYPFLILPMLFLRSIVFSRTA